MVTMVGSTAMEPGTTATGQPGQKSKNARLRRHLVTQLLVEVALPAAGYYGLRAAGVGEWAAVALGGALTLPWIVGGMIRHGKVQLMAVFTLSMIVIGALMGMVTGD